MKKIIMTAAAVFVFAFANAQDAAPEEKQGMHLGVKAGYMNSGFTGDFDSDDQSTAYFGGFLDLSITNRFHVQPEVLYSMEGADVKVVDVDADFGMDFISIPIMAKFYITDSFNIQAGPQVAFLVGENDFEDAASTDFRLGVGAAWEFGLLFIDARWNYGLSDLNDSSLPEYEGKELKSQSFTFGLGLRF